MPYRNAPETIDVLGKTVISEVILAITDTGAAHANGDLVGTDNTPFTFHNCAAENGGSGKVIGAVLVDWDLQSVAGDLWLFDHAPLGLPADNAAITITDASAKYFIGLIPFDTYYATALNSVSVGTPTSPLAFKCEATSNDLYGFFVTRGAPTYTTLFPFFRLYITQD